MNPKITLCLLIFLLIATVFFAILSGNSELSFYSIYNVFLDKFFGFDRALQNEEIIIWNLRMPRIFMAILAGIALSSAGAMYQSIFRNPLVEPFILGVSSGASFGASLAILLPFLFLPMQFSAFIFSLIAVFLAYFLAYRKGESESVSLVLSGVIIGSIFSALVSIMKYISEDSQLREITFWMMGGLYHAGWSDIWINFWVILPCFIIAQIFSWKLNILSIGDEEAKSLGVNPMLFKIIFILIATLMSAVCVSSVGIIAWVGLMMPHVARLLCGPDNRYILGISSLMGAIYILFCDTLARTLSEGEIPVGIITALIGSPFLIWILRSKSGKVFK